MDTSLLSIGFSVFLCLFLAISFSFYFIQIRNKNIRKKKQINVGSKQEVEGNYNQSISNVQGDVHFYGVNPNPKTTEQTEPTEQIEQSDGPDYNTNILFIDDGPSSESEMMRIKAISSYGYTNIHLINDGTVTSPAVVAAKIIFVDITGVGKAAGCADGTELAVLIKKKYKDKKKVAIYSSTETHNIQVKGLNLLDSILGKNDDTQHYIDFIEGNDERNEN